SDVEGASDDLLGRLDTALREALTSFPEQPESDEQLEGMEAIADQIEGLAAAAHVRINAAEERHRRAAAITARLSPPTNPDDEPDLPAAAHPSISRVAARRPAGRAPRTRTDTAAVTIVS